MGVQEHTLVMLILAKGFLGDWRGSVVGGVGFEDRKIY